MKKRFTITLDPKIAKQARIEAVKDDVSFSELIERLLTAWLKVRSDSHDEDRINRPSCQPQ